MSIPLTTPFTELMGIRAFSYVRASLTCPFIPSYLSLVCAPLDAIFLDVALLPTHPTHRGFLFIRGSLALALVGVILGMKCGGSRSVGGWFIPTSEVGGRVRDR